MRLGARPQVIRIITIEREYGCGASEIAREVAQRIGWKLWDQVMTKELARLANCTEEQVEQREERRDPLYYRFLKSFMRGSHEGSINVDPLELLEADSMVRLARQVVEKAAAEGNCVIVGRGSQHFLQDRDDALRFFLYAPKENKIRRLVESGMRESDAQMLVATVDRERGAFIKTYFHADWPNRAVYHAMINTAAGEEVAVRAILSFLDREQLAAQSA